MIEKFDNYLNYLNKWVLSQSRQGFGMQKKMAEFLDVKTSYISQVLSGTVILKEDYGLKLNEFLRHDPLEADYFMLLLTIERAGSYQLKQYYRIKAEALRSQLRAAINKDVNIVVEPSQDMDLELYYSSWHYSAAHALSATQEITANIISTRFALKLEAAQKIIDYLSANGFLIKKGTVYTHSKKGIHLPKDHRWVSKHHANWRAKTSDSFSFPNSDDLHYTSVATMSHKEMQMVREIMIDVIRDIRTVIEKSKDEKVYCYTLDLFEV